MTAIKTYKKCLWAIPLGILLNIDCLRPEPAGSLEGDLNYFFLTSFLDIRTYEGAGRTVLLMSFMSMSAILIFSLLCGMDIYKEMYSSGIYVIIRVKSKKKWILSLVIELAAKSFLFGLLYAVVTWLLELYYTRMKMNGRFVYAFFLAVTFIAISVFVIALSINYFSICKNTRVGTFVGVSILLVMITYVLFYDKIPVFHDRDYLQYLDPIYICNLFYENSPLKTGFIWLYYVIFLFLIVFCFVKMVGKTDIKLLNEDI